MSKETMSITREEIAAALRHELEPLEYVNAMWRGGSDATGTSDEWSDLDVQLDVADGRQLDAFEAVERALGRLSPIAAQWAVPEPAWHGHSQRLYRLADTPEHMMIDLCVMQRGSDAPRFDEREIHGEPAIVFDKLGVIRAVPLDRAPHVAAIAARVESFRARFALLRHLAGKEVTRGNTVSAISRYHAFVLTPLVAILRARYAPVFHDFGQRYLERHLPEQAYRRLERLMFTADMDDLAAKLDEAIAWAEQEFAAFDIDAAAAALDAQLARGG